jgi:hypothetical protein
MEKIMHYGRRVAIFALGFFAASTLLHWGWNSAIPELFGLPAIEHKQAVALLSLLGLASLVLAPRGRFAGGRHTAEQQ